MSGLVPQDIETVLPSAITSAATSHGNELVFPVAETERAIQVATEHQIAVLGVEVFRVLTQDPLHSERWLGVETYSGYEFEVRGDWVAFVAENNGAALEFVAENRRGEGYGYILTTTSKREFESLANPTSPTML
jgi:hypothetical protein